jgi:hypothetical protein
MLLTFLFRNANLAAAHAFSLLTKEGPPNDLSDRSQTPVLARGRGI